MEHEAGGGTVVASVQPLRQGADVDALVVKLLDGLEPLVRFRAKRSILGTTTVSPGFSNRRSSVHEGLRMFLPDATSVKMRSSRSPWSDRMRLWVASPRSPSAWETRM